MEPLHVVPKDRGGLHGPEVSIGVCVYACVCMCVCVCGCVGVCVYVRGVKGWS